MRQADDALYAQKGTLPRSQRGGRLIISRHRRTDLQMGPHSADQPGHIWPVSLASNSMRPYAVSSPKPVKRPKRLSLLPIPSLARPWWKSGQARSAWPLTGD